MRESGREVPEIALGPGIQQGPQLRLSQLRDVGRRRQREDVPGQGQDRPGTETPGVLPQDSVCASGQCRVTMPVEHRRPGVPDFLNLNPAHTPCAPRRVRTRTQSAPGDCL